MATSKNKPGKKAASGRKRVQMRDLSKRKTDLTEEQVKSVKGGKEWGAAGSF